MVRSRVGALEEDLPPTLQIWHCGNRLPQPALLLNSCLQLSRDELSAPEKGSQHNNLVKCHPEKTPRQLVVERLHSVGLAQNLGVVQESAELLTRFQSASNLIQSALDANAEQQRHQRVPLLSAFGLAHCTSDSILIPPTVR